MRSCPFHRRARVGRRCADDLPLAPAARAQLGGPIGSPVVFRSETGNHDLMLDGRGPFHGAIEVRREGSGVTIVNELDLDSYVDGVREVPGLLADGGAQGASRRGAYLRVVGEAASGYWKRFGFDVCATVSCQVYQGAAAGAGRTQDAAGRRPFGSDGGRGAPDAKAKPALDPLPLVVRWRHARQRGRVSVRLDARPYLRSVEDPYDKVSPLHRWKVRFHARAPAADPAATRSASEVSSSTSTADEAARKPRDPDAGGELEMTTVRFRREMSEHAPRVFPDLYPGPRDRRRTDAVHDPVVALRRREDGPTGSSSTARGYGHGVGMSQYGAMGRASDGPLYDEILARVLRRLAPAAVDRRQDTPRRGRTGRSARAVSSADGPFGVSTNGQSLAASTLGGWAASPSGVRSIAPCLRRRATISRSCSPVCACPDRVIVDPPDTKTSLDVDFVVPKPAQVTGVVPRDGKEVAPRADGGRSRRAEARDPVAAGRARRGARRTSSCSKPSTGRRKSTAKPTSCSSGRRAGCGGRSCSRCSYSARCCSDVVRCGSKRCAGAAMHSQCRRRSSSPS